MRTLSTRLIWPAPMPTVAPPRAKTIAFDLTCFATVSANSRSAISEAVGARFVTTVRVETARRLLEESSEGFEAICAQSGLGTPESMRRAFLRLVGVSIPLAAAMVIETALILVRALAVPVPAGLGVQDLGYVLSLKALSVPDPTTVGAAFVLLKRGKDAFWIAAGFVLLSLGRSKGAPLVERAPTVDASL